MQKRDTLFKEQNITKEELTIIKNLIEVNDKKKFYGTEEELSKRIRKHNDLKKYLKKSGY